MHIAHQDNGVRQALRALIESFTTAVVEVAEAETALRSFGIIAL